MKTARFGQEIFPSECAPLKKNPFVPHVTTIFPKVTYGAPTTIYENAKKTDRKAKPYYTKHFVSTTVAGTAAKISGVQQSNLRLNSAAVSLFCGWLKKKCSSAAVWSSGVPRQVHEKRLSNETSTCRAYWQQVLRLRKPSVMFGVLHFYCSQVYNKPKQTPSSISHR